MEWSTLKSPWEDLGRNLDGKLNGETDKGKIMIDDWEKDIKKGCRVAKGAVLKRRNTRLELLDSKDSGIKMWN